MELQYEREKHVRNPFIKVYRFRYTFKVERDSL